MYQKIKEQILIEYWENNITDYVLDCLHEHIEAIEQLLEIWYSIDDMFFEEILSGDDKKIQFNEIQKFNNALNSWKSELVPVLVFLLPNINSEENTSETRFLKISFYKSGMSWMY